MAQVRRMRDADALLKGTLGPEWCREISADSSLHRMLKGRALRAKMRAGAVHVVDGESARRAVDMLCARWSARGMLDDSEIKGREAFREPLESLVPAAIGG